MSLPSSFTRRSAASEPMRNAYLCSFHIPKTGGTTFANHARKSLGEEEFLLHGPFSRVDRFMRDMPQLEEISDTQRDAIKIIHGHGAGLAVAEIMVPRPPEFMVILRDPYERFVSGFHYFNNERKKSSINGVSEKRYLEMRGQNFYAKMLMDYFRPLSANESALTFEGVLPILQSIKYFMLTEYLDRQLQKISAMYGLKTGPIEARRINKSKSELSTSAEVFGGKNAIDLKICAALAEAAERHNSSIQNPFGYNPDPLMNYLEGVWAKQSSQARLDASYDELIEGGRKTFKLQAMQVKLIHTPASHVSDKPLLLKRVNAGLVDWLAGLNDQELSAATMWSGLVLAKEGDASAAETNLRKAIELNPQNDNALAHLAKLLHRDGKREEAKTYVDRAMVVNPDRPITQAVHKLIGGQR